MQRAGKALTTGETEDVRKALGRECAKRVIIRAEMLIALKYK
jgi:hypothetical protein